MGQKREFWSKETILVGRKKPLSAARDCLWPSQALRSVAVRLTQFRPQPQESYGRKMRPKESPYGLRSCILTCSVLTISSSFLACLSSPSSSSSWMNCISIGLPGKSILGDYFQENRTSPRPFLLLRISFPGRPIFIQFIPGGNCIKIGLPGKSILGDYFQENMTSQRPFLWLRISFQGRPIFIQFIPGDNYINIGLPGKSILGDYFQEKRTSRRPFLLLRISFPGRPFFYTIHPWINCINIGLPGKSILGDYFQENMTSQRPFLLLKIDFPGRPICIQLVPACGWPRAPSSSSRPAPSAAPKSRRSPRRSPALPSRSPTAKNRRRINPSVNLLTTLDM